MVLGSVGVENNSHTVPIVCAYVFPAYVTQSKVKSTYFILHAYLNIAWTIVFYLLRNNTDKPRTSFK